MDELRAGAERILCETSGAACRLDPDGEVLDSMPEDGYVTVARFNVSSPSDLPDTVIAKRPGTWAPYDPDSVEGAGPGLLNDWAALEFFGSLDVDVPIAPRFFGGDRKRGIILMEDLGGGDGLADLLLGNDRRAAEHGLREFAEALARMHAASAPAVDEYMSIRDALGPRRNVSYFHPAKVPGQIRDAFGSVDVAVSAAAAAEIDGVVSSIDDPGPFRTYSHGDPCPDNTRLVDGRLRFIDFEVGGIRHALLDAAYVTAPFPSCWCVRRLEPSMSQRLEATYRSTYTSRVPAATAGFDDGKLHALALWTLLVSTWYVEKAREVDDPLHRAVSTRRQGVLLRWQTFIEAAEAAGRMPAIVGLGRSLLARLADLWPAVEPMPVYPAFA